MQINEIEAGKGLSSLTFNLYPGRVMIVGRDETGKNLVQIYGITGRSPSSRNRILLTDDNRRVYTEVADKSQLKPGTDTSLIIYNAMNDGGAKEPHKAFKFVVSNGKQTDDILSRISDFEGFHNITRSWRYEPDHPIYTPRISAVCRRTRHPQEEPRFSLSLIRKGEGDNDPKRFLYEYDDIPAGFGVMLHTYKEDGNPPPPFEGEPRVVPIKGNVDAIRNTYWRALNKENRVSLAVKIINEESGSVCVWIANEYGDWIGA